MNELDEREFELINIIGENLGANQRDLSKMMDLSLGMVNLLIQRLAIKGFIRIERMKNRKVHYFLTPKGFAEKLRQSVRYTFKTVNSLALIYRKILDIVANLLKSGHTTFIIFGTNDFNKLMDMAFKELHTNNKIEIQYVHELPQGRIHGTVLICKEEIDEAFIDADHVVNVALELVKSDPASNAFSKGGGI